MEQNSDKHHYWKLENFIRGMCYKRLKNAPPHPPPPISQHHPPLQFSQCGFYLLKGGVFNSIKKTHTGWRTFQIHLLNHSESKETAGPEWNNRNTVKSNRFMIEWLYIRYPVERSGRKESAWKRYPKRKSFIGHTV